MGTLIVVLLILWAAIAVLGAAIKGFFWLTIVGVVLFVATAGWHFLRPKTSGE